MKNLWFGLIATVLFAFNLNAQKMTQENVRLLMAQGMYDFSASLKPTFDTSSTLEDFKKKTTGRSYLKITKEGNDLLTDAYYFLSTKATQDQIVNSYNGKAMAAAALYLDTLSRKGIKTDGSELFGGTTGDFNPYTNANLFRCNWYQIGCWIKEIFGEEPGQLIIDAGIKIIVNTLFGSSR